MLGKMRTVSLARLDRIREKGPSGKRTYVTGKVTGADMDAIEIAIINGLGLGRRLK